MPGQGARLLTPAGAPWPTGSTRVAAVIGDPVRHSLSPALHNSAFQALGLDWVYLALPVAAGETAGAITGMRALGVEGLSVTMPHKTAVAGLVDELTPTAAALGAVNTIVRRGSALVGDSTDGTGFLDALAADEGFDPRDRRCLVLGSGGAARAVVEALARAGAARVDVAGRTPAPASRAAALAGDRGAVITDLAEAVRAADLVVNATPVGMAGDPAIPFAIDPRWLGRHHVVVDLVYEPPITPLLAAARDRGCVSVNGIGMLIYQAAAAFRLWTGEDPPLEVMSAAAAAALAHRGTLRD